jgi:DNA replication protein DnaC
MLERILERFPPVEEEAARDERGGGGERPRGAPSPERLALPPVYWHASPCDVEHLCLDLDRPRSLFVYGENGAGKSHAAAVLAKCWGLRWVSVPTLLTRVRRSFDSRVEESEFDIVRELIEARGMVLDDLLAGVRSDFGLGTLFAVVNGRVEESRLTVVTSALDLATIDALDSGLASRLGGFDRVKIAGGDRRLRT